MRLQTSPAIPAILSGLAGNDTFDRGLGNDRAIGGTESCTVLGLTVDHVFDVPNNATHEQIAVNRDGLARSMIRLPGQPALNGGDFVV